MVREEASSSPRRAARVGCRGSRGVEVGGAHVTSGRNRFGARTFPGGLVGSEDGGAPHEQVIVAVWARAAPVRRLRLDRLEIRLEPQHRSRLLVRSPRHGSKSFSTEPGYCPTSVVAGSLAGADARRRDLTVEAGGLASKRARAFVFVRSRVWCRTLASLSTRGPPKKKSCVRAKSTGILESRSAGLERGFE